MAGEKIIMQSGVVPYWFDSGILKIVLVTARNASRNWIVPKGHIEKGLTPAESAKIEAHEEAGVDGNISDQKLGSFKYSKYGRNYKVDFYLLEVKKILKRWPEDSKRRRIIVDIETALELTSDSKFTRILKKTAKQVKQEKSSNG
jgi:8-oxo-dGTP pyrophosphatase MutT (NUDIX family)